MVLYVAYYNTVAIYIMSHAGAYSENFEKNHSTVWEGSHKIYCLTRLCRHYLFGICGRNTDIYAIARIFLLPSMHSSSDYCIVYWISIMKRDCSPSDPTEAPSAAVDGDAEADRVHGCDARTYSIYEKWLLQKHPHRKTLSKNGSFPDGMKW